MLSFPRRFPSLLCWSVCFDCDSRAMYNRTFAAAVQLCRLLGVSVFETSPFTLLVTTAPIYKNKTAISTTIFQQRTQSVRFSSHSIALFSSCFSVVYLFLVFISLVSLCVFLFIFFVNKAFTVERAKYRFHNWLFFFFLTFILCFFILRFFLGRVYGLIAAFFRRAN